MGLAPRSQSQLYLGLFERETCCWLNHLSEGITTAIDIGVTHGEYTLYILLKTKATKVFAFDPNVETARILDENLRLNGMANSERLEVSSKLVGGSDTEQEIRLDSLAVSIVAPCLVKMDVDGAEEQILKGAKLFNELQGIRWLIETHSRELEIACQSILSAAGLQTKIIHNEWWRVFVPELRPIEHNRWLAAWKSEGLCNLD